ncbi:MAG TPA: hypothetical protein VK633_15230 [Verrucomicrobiae bacterium]|nr:hypothetical protein [Verrucomicrobiae bacterium]
MDEKEFHGLEFTTVESAPPALVQQSLSPCKGTSVLAPPDLRGIAPGKRDAARLFGLLFPASWSPRLEAVPDEVIGFPYACYENEELSDELSQPEKGFRGGGELEKKADIRGKRQGPVAAIGL